MESFTDLRAQSQLMWKQKQLLSSSSFQRKSQGLVTNITFFSSFFFLLSKNIQHAQNFLQCAASKISSLIIVWLWFFLVRPLPPTSCFPTSWERLSSSTSTHTPQPISHSSPDRFVIFLFVQVLEINRVASQQHLNWKTDSIECTPQHKHLHL